jgi:hypothetical protein
MLMDGFLVFLGVMAILIKLPLRHTLWLLGRPVTLDVTITILVYFAHAGSIRGLMAAAVAGLMVSGGTSIARWLVGYIDKKTYYPGYIKLDPKEFMK